MSQEKIEIVRRFFEARNRRDLDSMVECLHQGVEFDLSESRSPYRGTFRGHDEVRRGFQDIFEAWDEFEMTLDDPLELADQVVVSVLVKVSGRVSGASWRGQGANIFTIKDGKIVRFRLFQSRDEALEAAGLSE